MTPTSPWLITDSFISYHIWNSADCTPIRYFFCADVIHGGPFSLLTLDVGKLNQVKFNDRLFWREGGEDDVWYNPRHLKHQRGNSSGSKVQRHQKRRSMRMIQMITKFPLIQQSNLLLNKPGLNSVRNNRKFQCDWIWYFLKSGKIHYQKTYHKNKNNEFLETINAT